MRQVIVYVYDRKPGKTYMDKVEDNMGYAKFHAWGCGYEEFESGPGNYSTAIIERTDGSVENVPADMIKFIGG
jgi:hypothetical protein